MGKPVPELSEQELERAYNRTWRKHFEWRNRVAATWSEPYGADNPELNVYTVELSIDWGTVIVKAKNPEDAEQIGRDEIYVMTDNFHQIDFDEGPGFAVESVELVEEAEAAE